jgi:hypothetical protein
VVHDCASSTGLDALAAVQPTSWQEAVLAPLASPGRSLDS